MKVETVLLKVVKSINDSNEVQPNEYTVIVDDEILFVTTNLGYALQAVLNRSI